MRHIVRVDVMQRLHPDVRELDLPALQQHREDFRVEVAGGIDWNPAGPYQVSGMQNGYRQRQLACLAQKICLFSYTHLDVYKRQDYVFAFGTGHRLRSSPADRVTTVSYTHLIHGVMTAAVKTAGTKYEATVSASR